MTSQPTVETKSTNSLDNLLLILSLAALVGGIVAFYYFEGQVNVTLRTVIVLGGLAAALGLAYQTELGRTMWTYVRGANVEVRKTTWPTRQESLQATLMIAIVVTIAALLLWGLDSALLWGVKSLTGRG